MFKWVHRSWLKFKVWHIGSQIEAEEREQNILLILRWVALEECDAMSYDYFGDLIRASNRSMNKLRNQRDGFTYQLERL